MVPSRKGGWLLRTIDPYGIAQRHHGWGIRIDPLTALLGELHANQQKNAEGMIESPRLSVIDDAHGATLQHRAIEGLNCVFSVLPGEILDESATYETGDACIHGMIVPFPRISDIKVAKGD